MNILKRGIRLIKKNGFLRALTNTVPWYLINSWFSLADDITVKRLSKEQAKDGFIVKEINGSKMYLNIYDRGLPRDLIISGVREPLSTERMKDEINEGDVVVDIGANIGYYALLESRLVGEKGLVYAIEPVPGTIEVLKRNIALNGYSNIEVFQLAMGNKTGTAPIYVSDQCNVSSMTQVREAARTIEVEVTTLDEFLRNKRYPDLIRMDVEGYEHEIVKGMERLLGENKPLKLFLEFHFNMMEKQQSIDLLMTLKESGFEIADAIIERDSMLRHKTPVRLLAGLEKAVYGAPISHGHLDVTIDEILKTDAILSSKWWVSYLFFKR